MKILIKKKEAWIWIILAIIYGYFFTTMVYADFAVTFEHGVLLCDSIFTGHFFDFYEHACDGIYNNPAVYDIGIYLLWAIWCIPVYIITRFWHVAAAETPILMLYGKLLVVLFHFMTASVVVKIGQQMRLSAEKLKMLLFLYVSSLCMIVPSIGNGQFDIIPTFLTVLGVYMFVKKDYRKFLIVMTFAVSFKIFAIFIAIPLILYKEKRIFYIIRDTIVLLLASAFFKLLFWGRTTDYYDTLYFYSPDQYTTGWVNRMFKIQLPGGLGEISIFILCFVLLCIYAYFGKKREDQEIETVLLFSFLTYLNFFLFIAAHPQWIVLLIPFLYLFAMCREKNYRFNVIIATLIDMLFLVCMSYKYNQVFWSNNESRGLEILFPFPTESLLGGSLGGLIDMLEYSYIYPGIVAILVALCFVFIFQFFDHNDRIREMREKGFGRRVIIGRIAWIGFYVITSLILCYI